MRGGVKPLVGRNRPGRRQRNVRRSRGLGLGASSPSSRRTPTGTGPSGRSAGPRGGRRRLGVLTLSEAAELRAAGLHGHILVMAPSSRRGPGRRAARDRVTVDSPALARFLSRPGTAPGPNPSELDYGLGRWGAPFRGSRAPPGLQGACPASKRQASRPHLDVPGKNAVGPRTKLHRFARVAEEAAARSRAGGPRELGRRARLPHRRFDLARVGNLLYGIDRTKAAVENLRAQGRVVSLRTVQKGARSASPQLPGPRYGWRPSRGRRRRRWNRRTLHRLHSPFRYYGLRARKGAFRQPRGNPASSST